MIQYKFDYQWNTSMYNLCNWAYNYTIYSLSLALNKILLFPSKISLLN